MVGDKRCVYQLKAVSAVCSCPNPQRCLDVWSLVAEAEAVHAGLAAAVDEAGEGGVLPLQAVRDDARARVEALGERLAAAAADGNAAFGDDGAIIARARDALQACHLLL